MFAVWPKYRAFYDQWTLEELASPNDNQSLSWRRRLIRNDMGRVTIPLFKDEQQARTETASLNQAFATALDISPMDATSKLSLQIKVEKRLQAKKRLEDEEALMLSEAVRQHQDVQFDRSQLRLHEASEPHRVELEEQLIKMPYLKVVVVGAPGRRKFLVLEKNSMWSEPYELRRSFDSITAKVLRARIANGFGFDYDDHWGKTKAAIREILKPRANKLLERYDIQRMLSEALAQGKRAIVFERFVFWYEPDGCIGWTVKEVGNKVSGSDDTIWEKGTIRSENYGRLIILPYKKANGELVRGHTKNAPHEGPAKPRHPDNYIEIPFEVLEGDVVRGLFGELYYEG